MIGPMEFTIWVFFAFAQWQGPTGIYYASPGWADFATMVDKTACYELRDRMAMQHNVGSIYGVFDNKNKAIMCLPEGMEPKGKLALKYR